MDGEGTMYFFILEISIIFTYNLKNNKMTPMEKEWMLSLPKEMKLKLLDDSLKEGEFGIFMGITKILLDAPISGGGISTEEIEEVRKKYF